jgi:hypothetical protein
MMFGISYWKVVITFVPKSLIQVLKFSKENNTTPCTVVWLMLSR